jgi:uncharacterized membrane protein
MVWLQGLQFLEMQNGWSILALGILTTFVVVHLLLSSWQKHKTHAQRKAYIYPFIVLGWVTTSLDAFATAFFHHYYMTAILVGCLGLQVWLFLHRLRTERTSSA